MNAIYILWLRQMKRYVRSRTRIVASLAQPLLFLFALGFGFGPVFEKAGHGNYIQFIAPGVIGMTVLFNSMFSGIELIWDRQFGFLKETLVAPVSRISIMTGRHIGRGHHCSGAGAHRDERLLYRRLPGPKRFSFAHGHPFHGTDGDNFYRPGNRNRLAPP